MNDKPVSGHKPCLGEYELHENSSEIEIKAFQNQNKTFREREQRPKLDRVSAC